MGSPRPFRRGVEVREALRELSPHVPRRLDGYEADAEQREQSGELPRTRREVDDERSAVEPRLLSHPGDGLPRVVRTERLVVGSVQTLEAEPRTHGQDGTNRPYPPKP